MLIGPPLVQYAVAGDIMASYPSSVLYYDSMDVFSAVINGVSNGIVKRSVLIKLIDAVNISSFDYGYD